MPPLLSEPLEAPDHPGGGEAQARHGVQQQWTRRIHTAGQSMALKRLLFVETWKQNKKCYLSAGAHPDIKHIGIIIALF